MASGEATSAGFAAGGAAVGGGVTTVCGGAWFCARLVLTHSSKHSPPKAITAFATSLFSLNTTLRQSHAGSFFTAVVIGRKAIVFSLNFLSDLENRTIIHESLSFEIS